jgi:hypothetical protein
MQKLDDVTLLEFHRSDLFNLSPFTSSLCLPFLPGKIPDFCAIHESQVTIDGCGLGSPREEEPPEDQ